MEKISDDNLPEIFLFVNSGSGSGVGKEIFQLQISEKVFRVPKSQYENDKNNLVDIKMHFFNLRDKESKKNGFQKLKTRIQNHKKAILVMCGGDGTVMWVVSQLAQFGIDSSKVPIAIIPLGTGNDFAQNLGWGKSSPDILSNDFQKLKKRITYWLSATEQPLDIWMVEANVQDYGKFEKANGKQNELLPGKTFEKHFCNYFSIGIDGKIGYSFDMHRTSSRMGNLAMYAILGFVKGCTKTKTLGELTKSMKESRETREGSTTQKNEGELSKMSNSITKCNQPLNINHIVLDMNDKSYEHIKNNQNILMLNINSFMGGIKDVWKNSKQNSNIIHEKYTQPSHQDGKLQIISFGGAFSMGFQKTAGGFGDKIHQGSGPFELLFKQFPPQQKHRTYLQIDGEFIRFTHPKSVIVRKSTYTPSGQIKVLKRVPKQKQKGCCS